MMRTTLLAATAMFALSTGVLAGTRMPVPASNGFDVRATRLSVSTSKLKTLYSQNDNDGGNAVFSTYNSAQGADDFVVPPGGDWKIKEVDVTGVYYNGSGSGSSENVYFYDDNDGLPGALVKSAMNVKGIDNGLGSLAITIPTVKLKAGRYWVSVQVNCQLGGCGEWGWEVRSVQANDLSAWQSPNNPPCPVWATMESCLGAGPDLMFALKGKK
jgi:hypothetical protein